MTEEKKGPATMMNVAHASNSAVATAVGGVSTGNFEPLFLELIKAVRAVSLTVNVPALGLPDINVAAPAVNVATPEVHVAAPSVSVTVPAQVADTTKPQYVVVNGPNDRLRTLVLVSIWIMLVADVVCKLVEFKHAGY